MDTPESIHPLPYFLVMMLLQKHTMAGNFDHIKYTALDGDKVTCWRLDPFKDGNEYSVSSHNNTKEGEFYSGDHKTELFHHVIAYNSPKDNMPVWRVTKLEKE